MSAHVEGTGPAAAGVADPRASVYSDDNFFAAVVRVRLAVLFDMAEAMRSGPAASKRGHFSSRNWLWYGMEAPGFHPARGPGGVPKHAIPDTLEEMAKLLREVRGGRAPAAHAPANDEHSAACGDACGHGSHDLLALHAWAKDELEDYFARTRGARGSGVDEDQATCQFLLDQAFRRPPTEAAAREEFSRDSIMIFAIMIMHVRFLINCCLFEDDMARVVAKEAVLARRAGAAGGMGPEELRRRTRDEVAAMAALMFQHRHALERFWLGGAHLGSLASWLEAQAYKGDKAQAYLPVPERVLAWTLNFVGKAPRASARQGADGESQRPVAELLEEHLQNIRRAVVSLLPFWTELLRLLRRCSLVQRRLRRDFGPLVDLFMAELETWPHQPPTVPAVASALHERILHLRRGIAAAADLPGPEGIAVAAAGLPAVEPAMEAAVEFAATWAANWVLLPDGPEAYVDLALATPGAHIIAAQAEAAANIARRAELRGAVQRYVEAALDAQVLAGKQVRLKAWAERARYAPASSGAGRAADSPAPAREHADSGAADDEAAAFLDDPAAADALDGPPAARFDRPDRSGAIDRGGMNRSGPAWGGRCDGGSRSPPRDTYSGGSYRGDAYRGGRGDGGSRSPPRDTYSGGSYRGDRGDRGDRGGTYRGGSYRGDAYRGGRGDRGDAYGGGSNRGDPDGDRRSRSPPPGTGRSGGPHDASRSTRGSDSLNWRA